MSCQNFRIYRLQPYSLQETAPVIHVRTTDSQHTDNSQLISQTDLYNNDQSHDLIEMTTSTSHYSQLIQDFTNSNAISFQPWRPSQRLRSLHTHFQNTILCQHICLPCAFCGKLLYPAKAKWIQFDENYTYPLEENFQNISIYIRGQGSTRTVCVCDSCKNNRRRYPCPRLCPIPDVIETIPAAQRRFLSPVFLHCSLGRNLDANRYTEYHTLVGDMEFSKNMRTLNCILVF
jgi:hypothetical protein